MIRRLGTAKIVQMTTHALRRQTLPVERTDCSYLVAGVAIDCRMRANERKPVLMLINSVNRNLPTRIAVAQVTLGSILAPVNIGMTVLALSTDVRKNRIDVALLALHFRMETAKRKTCPAVVELWNSSYGHPALCGVAIFTPDIKSAVRTLCRSTLDRERALKD
jgi:hypothetical protein